jgi:drug/metabolite transporter (DMT)-like permease
MKRLQLVLAFSIIYIVWGSTYVAIRVGVVQMHWALMAGLRFLAAGLIMLGALAVLRRPLRVSRRDLAVLAASGFLLLGSGNGFVFLAETTVPAGLAALVIATIPLWIAALESLLPGGEPLAPRGWLGIGLGLLGLGVLLAPQLARDSREPLSWIGIGALLIAALSWSAGTLLLRRRPVRLDAFAATGYEMVFGGLFNLGIAAVLWNGSPLRWTPELAGALGYLIVLGSLVAFTAYTWLTRHVTPARLATYAYVNPVVAVLLGVLLLREPAGPNVLAGMAVVLAGVVLVSRAPAAVRPAVSLTAAGD